MRRNALLAVPLALAACASAETRGDRAVAVGDWKSAERAYAEALQRQPNDPQKMAKYQRVRLRPYAIRIRSVLVKPFRPDGAPWSGGRTGGFDRVVGLLASAAIDATAAFDPDGAGARTALGLYDALPHENRPNLVFVVTLPDGRRFASPPQRTIRAWLYYSVAVETNFHDDRPVTIRVTSADPAGDVDVGTVSFRLMDLLQARQMVLRDGSVMELRVSGEPSSLPDGGTEGFVPVTTPAR